MNTIITVENGEALKAIQNFLKQLLERKIVEAIYVPLEDDHGAIIPALVVDPVQLNHANPLAPFMPINGARAVSALTGKHAPAKIGAVLRSCEVRALIELVKLQQAALENVVLIGVDCAGTFEIETYNAKRSDGGIHLTKHFAATQGDAATRPACQMCVQPIPKNVDIHLHLLGADMTRNIPITIKDEIAAQLELTEIADAESNSRQVMIEKWIDSHTQVRERELAAIRTRLNADGGITGMFASCIRCHNCMTACPICYCKTCLFKSSAFDHAPDHYLTAALRKGATRMLGDAMLFHLTRMNHISLSCVNCGLCTSACPSDIPVGTIFSAVSSQTQATFNYLPGRDVNEPLPLITFQPNEWTEVGEAK